MEDWTILLIFGVFFVLFFGVVIVGVISTLVFALYYQNLKRRKVGPEWRRAAEKLGLDIESQSLGAPRLQGRVNNVPIEVFTKVTMIGPESSDRPVWAMMHKHELRTYYTTKLHPSWDGVTFTQNDVQSGMVLDALGMKDYPTGDPEFDEAIRIRGNVSHQLASLLAEHRIRQAILKLADEFLLFQISGGTLLVQITGAGNSSGELIHHINSVTEAAAILNGARAHR